jgi:uncharacterized membrane protein
MTGIFEMVLRLSAAGSLTCLVIYGLTLLLRSRLPKAWLYGLWLAAVLRFLLPVAFSLPFPILQLADPYVAGVLALGWQVDLTLTKEEIVTLLVDSA